MNVLVPNIEIRRAGERFHTDAGWLDSHHSFSFSNHYDPNNTNHGLLLVSNDDIVRGGTGFSTHPHQDMEIITYMVSGELSHRDSMGNGETIHPHEVQRMTAGTGVRHSEYSSPTDKTHLLQIWILPEKENLEPGYEQKIFSPEEKQGKLRLVASRGGDDGSVKINQDVDLYASILNKGDQVSHDLVDGRHAWLQLISGSIDVNGETLNVGDGAAISEERTLRVRSLENYSEFLLFDLN